MYWSGGGGELGAVVLPSKGLCGEMFVGVLTGLSSIGVQLSEVPAVDLAEAPAAMKTARSITQD